MFLVRDSVADRRKVIEFFLAGKGRQPSIALLLAVIDLERTLQRTIRALGCTKTTVLNARLGVTDNKSLLCYTGIMGLKRAWNEEVKPRYNLSLSEDLSKSWSDVLAAFKLRNELVHGNRGPATYDFSKKKVKAVLDLVGALDKFAKDNGHNLQERLRRRLKDCKS